VAQSLIESPIGPLLIVTSDKGVRLLSFVDGTQHDALASTLAPDAAADTGAAEGLLTEATRQLKEYFEGERREFALPLDPAGTDFQRRVWRTIAAIPFGQTASYAEVAVSAGAPNAYRAAGTACATNPIAVIVPCHRVIGSDRALHGYGGGLDSKVWLLRHEGALAGVKADGWANASPSRRLPLPV
jgi:methylated-DNA-[protein]-cysteine S-methyltransferase